MTTKEIAVAKIMSEIKERKAQKKFQHDDDIRAVRQHGWVNSNTKGRYKRRK